MNAIDIVLGILLLLGLIRGFMKGFIIELTSLVALLAGIYGTIHFSYLTVDFLVKHLSWSTEYIHLTAFAITFILIVVLILLIGKILTKLASAIALGLLNRLLGGVFGLLKMAFIASVVLMFLEAMEGDMDFFIDEKQKEASVLYQPVQQLAPLVLPSLLEEAQKIGIETEFTSAVTPPN